MKFLLSFTAILLLSVSCSSKSEDDLNNDEILNDDSNIISPDTTSEIEAIDTSQINTNTDHADYTREVYYTEGKGWGYKILMNGEPYINQPHIPAVSGNKGFESEEKAAITADFAVLKIKNGFMPPTLSIEELDSLGVLE